MCSRLSKLNSGSPRNHCMGSRSWCNGRCGSLPVWVLDTSERLPASHCFEGGKVQKKCNQC